MKGKAPNMNNQVSQLRPDGADVTISLDEAVRRSLGQVPRFKFRGRVIGVSGQVIRVTGVTPKLGEVCRITVSGQTETILAEVVGFEREVVLMLPYQATVGLAPNAEVIPTGSRPQFIFSRALLGRVVNGLGHPIDHKGPISGTPRGLHSDPPDPLRRQPIELPFYTGVHALDATMTMGIGQRMGIFAPAGVGKSTLLGMIARNSVGAINVIALIGERGREVSEFLRDNLGPEGLARSVVVVATSDRSAAERLRAAYVATSIAEGFRDQGASVLLMMDSLTRFARAHREVGLAAGEPPTRRGYPPSFFAELPRLLERSGQGVSGGITALYTVLVEGDSDSDPVAEEARSILDGHIALSKKLAQEGWYPAIDVLESVSRVMPMITSQEHQRASRKARSLLSRYADVQMLLQIGEYKKGGDLQADEAVAKHAALKGFLTQSVDDRGDFHESIRRLVQIAD